MGFKAPKVFETFVSAIPPSRRVNLILLEGVGLFKAANFSPTSPLPSPKRRGDVVK